MVLKGKQVLLVNNKLRVMFLTRIDNDSKKGGDSFQILMYMKELELRGHLVEVCCDIRKIDFSEKYDYFILVNSDRYLEVVSYHSTLKGKGLLHKTLILPIHHSYEAIKEYENEKSHGLTRLVFKILGSYENKEKAKNFYRIRNDLRLLPIVFKHLFINYKATIRNIFETTRAVILIAEGEKQNIERDFSVKLKDFVVVKNGVNINYSLKVEDFQNRQWDYLICGRIEPRKNSFELAKHFKDSNLKVCFVGALNKNNRSYNRDFEELVKSSDALHHYGYVDPEKMKNMYLNSKAHISASWFEVASLVDLEAYAHGCNVISSVNGNTRDYIYDDAVYISPKELGNINNLAEKSPRDSLVCFEFIKDNYTWKHSAVKLEGFLLSLN